MENDKYSPCMICFQHYGEQYSEECDDKCDYAFQTKVAKWYKQHYLELREKIIKIFHEYH